jgi:hypothetical protein
MTLPNLDDLKARWLGDLVAILPHRRKVHFDSLGHAFFNDLDRRTGRDAARKIWYMGTKTGSGRRDQNGVGFHNKPACLSIDFFVFGSTSSEACPAMVTFPGFSRMSVLAVAAFLILQDPPVVAERFDHIANLHELSVTAYTLAPLPPLAR